MCIMVCGVMLQLAGDTRTPATVSLELNSGYDKRRLGEREHFKAFQGSGQISGVGLGTRPDP